MVVLKEGADGKGDGEGDASDEELGAGSVHAAKLPAPSSSGAGCSLRDFGRASPTSAAGRGHAAPLTSHASRRARRFRRFVVLTSAVG